MTVSVVVPTLNGARWIRDQLDALAKQTFTGEWELIVADNGSTDDTRRIAESWKHRFARFRLVDASGGPGPWHNRNEGARAATGDVVLFTDQDDIVCPDWIGHLTEGLRHSSIVTGPVEHFVDGRPPPWRNVPGARERPPSGAFEPLIGCNMGISRELLFQVGGFDDTSPLGWEDIDLSIRATSRGISIGWAEHAIVLRRRPSSARSLWQKEFAYGRGWTMLERRYPQLSSDGRVTPMLRRAGWLAIRVPYVMHPARRNGWVGRAAALSGRLTERVHPSA